MKKIILSAVVASMALTTAASAIENVKANGLAKMIYQVTDNQLQNDGLFDKTNALGQAAIHLGMSADLSTNLSGAFEVQSVSTLGLENSLVSGTMATNSKTNTNSAGVAAANGELATDDQFWISQAYLTYKMGNTVAKVGLQELNTPLAFTEKWNVVNNTFQAFVLVNNDIKDVTLVGAYVGKGNGADDNTTATAGNLNDTNGQTVAYDGQFSSFVDGAYAVGAISKIGGINAQAWYYNVQVDDTIIPNVLSSIDAYWLEADTKVGGFFIGGQYAGTSVNGGTATVKGEDLNAYAVKIGTDVAGVHVFGAVSGVSGEANAAGVTHVNKGFANVATNDKTKLYTGTGSIYADGTNVANEDTDAWKIGASTKIAGYALAANYTDIDYGVNAANSNGEAQAWDVSAGTTVGPVALKAIYTEYEVKNGTSAVTSDLKTLRFIASAKF